MNFSIKPVITNFILFLMVFSSCKENNTVHLSGELTAAEANQAILSNGFMNFIDTINLNNGTLNHTLELSQPKILTFKVGKQITQLYLTPGSNLAIGYDDKKKAFTFTGDNALENTAISDFNRWMTDAERSNPGIQIAAYGEHEFVEILNKKFRKAQEYLEMQKQNIAPDLYKRLVNRVNQASSLDMVRYPTYHKYATMKEVEMTQGYHEQINQININDPDLLDFTEGVALGRAMVEKGIDFEKIRSVTKYYQALVDKVGETFDNPELKEYFTYSYLRDKINYGGGIDEIEEQLNSFYSSASNNYLVRTLKGEAVKWEDLTRGKEAPDFSGTTRNGDLVKLSDLKGKNVYIDVWATWCGPCIREIPSLKEVEHDYEDKNVEFVSISIDAAKDYEKWEKFIEEKDLGGTQLFAANDWKSEVATSYNIRGIPRFILIDDEGKIVKADAPRPASPELRELLSEIGI